MYVNSGYLHNSVVHFKDKSRPLVVGSCGTFRLYRRPRLPTYRPRGRIDFQLLYVAAGKAHFFLNDEDVIVTAGHMVLYQPKEIQRYVYYGVDQTEVYWVHFTGGNVKNILKSYGIPLTEHVFYTGQLPEYQNLYLKMIQELKECNPHYEELLVYYLRQLFILVSRKLNSRSKAADYIQSEIESAIRYFSDHFQADIVIDQYAASIHRSTAWFIRNFKHYTGMTPMQYIISVRMTHAQQLLSTTDYNITEISAVVGYDNPLYFSRLFKKQIGLSPTDYRKNL